MGLYVEAVDLSLKKSLECIDSDANGVSKSLMVAINTKWSEICPTIFNDFVDMCEAALSEEKDFGTINHYLQDKYTEDMLLPDEVVSDFMDRLKASDLVEPYGEDLDEPYMKNGSFWVDEKKPITGIRGTVTGHETVKVEISWKSNLADHLNQAKRKWGEEFGKKTLHEQLQRRLLAAVKAAWAVEKKTFTDMVLKKTRDYVLNARKKWVRTQLLVDQDLRANAIEDASQELRRQEIKKDIEKLRKCQNEINKILSPVM